MDSHMFRVFVGKPVIMKCRVDATPEASLTWYKDGVELTRSSLREKSDMMVTMHASLVPPYSCCL